jgi:hypothetical protein
LFLTYHDTASGQSALLSEVDDAAGEIQPDGQVLYRRAFQEPLAHVRYRVTRQSLEQDIVLLERPALDPEALGLDPRTTRLEVWTEFFDTPAPAVERQALRLRAANRSAGVPELWDWDQALDFGTMKVVAGAAFALGDAAAGQRRVPVAKSWQRLAGRDFLIESVD